MKKIANVFETSYVTLVEARANARTVALSLEALGLSCVRLAPLELALEYPLAEVMKVLAERRAPDPGALPRVLNVLESMKQDVQCEGDDASRTVQEEDAWVSVSFTLRHVIGLVTKVHGDLTAGELVARASTEEPGAIGGKTCAPLGFMPPVGAAGMTPEQARHRATALARGEAAQRDLDVSIESLGGVLEDLVREAVAAGVDWDREGSGEGAALVEPVDLVGSRAADARRDRLVAILNTAHHAAHARLMARHARGKVLDAMVEVHRVGLLAAAPSVAGEVRRASGGYVAGAPAEPADTAKH